MTGSIDDNQIRMHKIEGIPDFTDHTPKSSSGMKAFLAFHAQPLIPSDSRPTLIIANDIIGAAKQCPGAIKITECLVKDIVIKKEK